MHDYVAINEQISFIINGKPVESKPVEEKVEDLQQLKPNEQPIKSN